MDKTVFFRAVREKLFPNGIKEMKTVSGIEEILDYFAAEHPDRPVTQLAYILATSHHETGGRHYPVREGSVRGVGTEAQAVKVVARLFEQGKIKRNYALPDRDTGKRYYGRGRVQLTHKANYLIWQSRLGIPLVNNPDLILTEPGVDVAVLVEGMIGGTFRPPHKLDGYLNATRTDYFGARNIVNGGSDRAQRIADLAIAYEAALRKAGWKAAKPAAKPVQPLPPPPPAPVSPAPEKPATDVRKPTGKPWAVAGGIMAAVAALLAWIFFGGTQ